MRNISSKRMVQNGKDKRHAAWSVKAGKFVDLKPNEVKELYAIAGLR